MPLFPVDTSDRKEIGNTGEKISAIGLGTWDIKDARRAIESMILALELGVDHIDTAEMYGDGKAESIVGEAVKSFGRDRVFITTKLLPHRFRSMELAVKAAKNSLSRLGINSADLILIHWPDYLTPIERQVRNLEALARNGLTRYIGVSNFTKEQLDTAINATSKFEIVVDQVKYSVLDRAIEGDILRFAVQKNVTIQAYTPLERGRVAEVGLLRQIGEKYGKTAVQVALNFLISRPRTVAIPKAEKPHHVREIVGSLGWRLDESDIEVIENTL
ncbi:MAG: aldo/keto reductase [Desulfurococcales archaeon]|nr:aldo/keto reductase [Desulfurococcales archaeon]